MKTEWYFEHQRRFKLYKKLENLQGDCTQQLITANQISEEWVLTKAGEGIPDLYKFTGNRIHGNTKVYDPYGKEISITEIDIAPGRTTPLTEY